MTKNFKDADFAIRPDKKVFLFFKSRPYVNATINFIDRSFETQKSDLTDWHEARTLETHFLLHIVKPEFRHLIKPVEPQNDENS